MESTQSIPGYWHSLTILAYSDAGVGVVAKANGAGGAPSVSLASDGSESFVVGVGNGPASSTPRTEETEEAFVTQYADGSDNYTSWTQGTLQKTSYPGQQVTLGVDAPIDAPWNMVAVEVASAWGNDVGPPALIPNTVNDGLASSDITYDTRGNTTRLADMNFRYDASNKHIRTTYDDGSTVQIKRDVAGRIISRTIHTGDGVTPDTTTKYFYAGASDAAWGQRQGSVTARTIGLPGGVTRTVAGSETTWSFPNMLGHTLVTRAGTTNGPTQLWDPFGQPLHPETLAIGTAASDDSGQSNGNTGWHQGALKPAESVGSTAVIEMGARLYVPALGRFLQVDPIEGGVDNDYVWPPDPINKHDLSGEAVAIPVALLLAVAAALLLIAYVTLRGPWIPIIPAIRFAWPQAPADRKAERAAAADKAIPKAQRTNFRADKPYTVYQISQVGTGEVWKYGITSAVPATRRPSSQLAKCAEKFGACETQPLFKTTGYYNARLIEYDLIYAYYMDRGQCPPGQDPSCKSDAGGAHE